MSYVARRILIELEEEAPKNLSEQEFIAIERPLILLGEPGAGKTNTVKALAEIVGGTVVHAEAVASGKTPNRGLYNNEPVPFSFRVYAVLYRGQV
jgi:replication-associated recombination protein RarA